MQTGRVDAATGSTLRNLSARREEVDYDDDVATAQSAERAVEMARLFVARVADELGVRG